MCERERERERDSKTETDRERDRQRQRETDRDREGRQTDRHRQRTLKYLSLMTNTATLNTSNNTNNCGKLKYILRTKFKKLLLSKSFKRERVFCSCSEAAKTDRCKGWAAEREGRERDGGGGGEEVADLMGE